MLSPDVDAPSSMAAIDFQDQGIGIALQPGYEVASVLLDACEQLVL
jgi:aminoglycoside/choline kinase family phosphotransferase